MGRVTSAFVTGLLFGLGLTLAGLISPAKVTAFLDVTGNWDPSLAFTMAGAIAMTAVGFRLALKRGRPFLDSVFALPPRMELNRGMLAGAVIFGVGWGLGGYCPGPALAGLGLGGDETYVFVIAMLVGMMAARFNANRLSPPASRTA